jgi:hypothetical protein
MADSSTPAIRQRKKRKWDQPGEAVAMAAYTVSAMPGMLFGGAGNSTGLGMPNMLASLVGAFPTMTLPMPLVPYSAPCSTVPNNAAVAIVQKINQVTLSLGSESFSTVGCLLPSSLFLLQRKGQMYMSAIRNLI